MTKLENSGKSSQILYLSNGHWYQADSKHYPQRNWVILAIVYYLEPLQFCYFFKMVHLMISRLLNHSMKIHILFKKMLSWLIYSVVLISALQQSDSVKHIYTFFFASFPLWLSFPGGSMVKNPPSNAGERIQCLGPEDPLEKEMAMEGSGRLQSWGRKRSDMAKPHKPLRLITGH